MQSLATCEKNSFKSFNDSLEMQSDPSNGPENIEKLAWEPCINFYWWKVKLKYEMAFQKGPTVLMTQRSLKNCLFKKL